MDILLSENRLFVTVKGIFQESLMYAKYPAWNIGWSTVKKNEVFEKRKLIPKICRKVNKPIISEKMVLKCFFNIKIILPSFIVFSSGGLKKQ